MVDSPLQVETSPQAGSPGPRPPLPAAASPPGEVPWQQALARAIRSPEELCRALRLPSAGPQGRAVRAVRHFPVFVPWEYVWRMRPGCWDDPLLKQVWPAAQEDRPQTGYGLDPVGDLAARRAPGLLQKYQGRALLLASTCCAVHCRYCFRREFPYQEQPQALRQFQPALEQLAADHSVREVILSGGDPLVRPDGFLASLVEQLERMEHLQWLRIHTRLPVLIPQRVCPELLAWLRATRFTVTVVLHANHAQELDAQVERACRKLQQAGAVLLNQAVLLRGINDSVPALEALCRRLVDCRVVPYYLHQLDRVQGAAHFEVPVEQGQALMEQLRRRLPGYAVPRYVQEQPGAEYKLPLA